MKDQGFFNSIKQVIRMPSLNNRIFKTGRHIGQNILSARDEYEGLIYRSIPNYSLPHISIYPNSDFKTAIYKTTDDAPSLDDIFYKQENLIPYGKEYWFAIFTSLDNKKPMQLISTFGRRNSRKSVVDNIEVNGLNSTNGVLGTGSFAWCFDGKKKLFVPTTETKTTISGKSISATGEGLDIAISGTAPLYNVKVNSGPIKCDFNVRKPSSGYDEEVLNEHKMGMNYQVYNLYYDFDGTLNDKEFKGRCYLQKVILSTPMVPWHWGRLVFKDGSFFVFFKPYLGSKDLNYQLRNKGIFYHAGEDRMYGIHNIDVKHDSRMTNWKFACKGDDYSLNVAVKSYANHGFNFRYGGAFNYDEYMVNVKKFDFKTEGRKINLKKLGNGAGIVENASGILI